MALGAYRRETFAAGPFMSAGAANINFTAIAYTGSTPNCAANSAISSLNVTVEENPDVTDINYTSLSVPLIKKKSSLNSKSVI